MLSICIPVFNWDIANLVNELHLQAIELSIASEIVLIDDASLPHFQEQNATLQQLEKVRYIQLPQNIGRSKIRNRFLQEASFPYLLFMDCDSRVLNPNYLLRYANLCKGETIVCGGRTYYTSPPKNNNQYLRWYYGIHRECSTASERKKVPNRSFMTNNFMVSKTLLEKIRFDESLQGYGHEDTLFGYELKKHSINIQHIDNQLIHIGLESNDEFLRKTEQGIQNLFCIYMKLNKESRFSKDVKLLAVFQKLEKLHLKRVYRLILKMFGSYWTRNLRSHTPKLHWFDLWKLGLLIECETRMNSSLW